MRIEEMGSLEEEIAVMAERIALSSGILVSAAQNLFDSAVGAQERAIIDAIDHILSEEEKKSGKNAEGCGARYEGCQETDTLRDLAGEPEAAYLVKKEGGYTLEDYYALPDEKRVELIDGVFYDMSAPAIIHQKILGDLFILFRECMDSHEGECEVYLSPCDVRLDMDNRTMVQPDLLVVCRVYDIGAKRFEGAPDLTLEILSPSTRSKDMLLKLHKYTNASVREYWIVDPEQQTVLVYDLEKGEDSPRKYSFDDKVPIGISGGTCSIDFSRILRRIQKYYE